jgi:hypothetical protein
MMRTWSPTRNGAKFKIINYGGRSSIMANGNGLTKQDLLDEIDALHQENADLQDTLDGVYDIVAPPPDHS